MKMGLNRDGGCGSEDNHGSGFQNSRGFVSEWGQGEHFKEYSGDYYSCTVSKKSKTCQRM